MKSELGRKPQGFSIRSRFKSFGDAFSGLGLVLKGEHNAWIHFAATVAVLIASFALGISASDWRWIVLAIGLVWSAEAFTTAIEGLCNIINPEFDHRIGTIKDVSAGAVLVCAIVSTVIGLMTFEPYFVPFL